MPRMSTTTSRHRLERITARAVLRRAGLVDDDDNEVARKQGGQTVRGDEPSAALRAPARPVVSSITEEDDGRVARPHGHAHVEDVVRQVGHGSLLQATRGGARLCSIRSGRSARAQATAVLPLTGVVAQCVLTVLVANEAVEAKPGSRESIVPGWVRGPAAGFRELLQQLLSPVQSADTRERSVAECGAGVVSIVGAGSEHVSIELLVEGTQRNVCKARSGTNLVEAGRRKGHVARTRISRDERNQLELVPIGRVEVHLVLLVQAAGRTCGVESGTRRVARLDNVKEADPSQLARLLVPLRLWLWPVTMPEPQEVHGV
mmetsp:Transcript_11108/g.35268  ORF Transcript_11108/g.35268 Transcript_11108/m.35268 type:complete len:318 (+) Transcript_11108:300-1253(+)